MGHTPYGYRIENGIAVIDEKAAEKLRKLYENYLTGMALKAAAAEAGINTYHGTAKRLLMTRHYIGDDFYPAIIDATVFQNVQEELMKQIQGLQDVIKSQPTSITMFDETLVTRLIEKVTVFEDKFIVEFKSGVALKIER